MYHYRRYRLTPSVLGYFCSQCADVASSKGHSGAYYSIMSGLLTVGGGVLAMAVGFLLMGYENGIVWCYFLFVGGAVAGATVSWIIVQNLKKIVQPFESAPLSKIILRHSPVSGQSLDKPGPVWCIKCGRQLPPQSKVCDCCGAKVPMLE